MVSFSIVGCAHEPAHHEVTFSQLITDPSDNHFAVDLSQVSANWIESRTVEHHQWGDEEVIKIDPQHPVRIVVVPLPGPTGK